MTAHLEPATLGQERAPSASAPAVLADPRDRPVRPAGLVKTFGRVVGLDGVDLDLYPGEVLADHRRQRRRQIHPDQGLTGA